VSHASESRFDFLAPQSVRRIERAALVVGVLGAVACIAGAIVEPAQHFLRSYLVGFMYWLGVTLGCLAILMVAHVTTAHWGFVVRRILEAASLNVFMMALLFVPILAGVHRLYPWANADALAKDSLMQHQSAWLNGGGFILRAVIYFALWCLLAFLLNKWSWAQDKPGAPSFRERYQNLSAVGLMLYVFTMTFASIDWMMSLDPHWKSTIYGFYIEAGQGLNGFAFVTIVAALLIGYKPMSEVLSKEHLHDLGKLMFAFLILWAYMAFSQGLIYWSTNLPEEISWYRNRMSGSWWMVGAVLLFGQFFLPFFVLLGQEIKRKAATIAVVALWMMLMRWFDLYYLIIPNFEDTRGTLSFSWVNIASTLGIGGLWVALFFHNLKLRPLLAEHDPMFHEVLEGEHAAVHAGEHHG
jgi:hypothetical protein